MTHTWEYLTTTLSTEGRTVPVSDQIPPGPHPKYSVYALMPQLNEFGQQGWELVSLEPVQEGRNGDLRYCDAAGGQWTYTYLAAFKRPTGSV